MCTRYVSPEAAAIERAWHVGRGSPWRGGEVWPRKPGAFIRAARDDTSARELVIGQWWLIAPGAKERFPVAKTCNARFEGLAQRWSFKFPWRDGKRCIIPAESFFEPNWETGKHVPWRFRRADGQPWGLAGLWNTWTDPTSGEIVESYTMLTMNADAHPLMKRMHRPDPTRGPDQQDKRSVVPINVDDVEQWLCGSIADATALVRLAPVGCFDAAPEPV